MGPPGWGRLVSPSQHPSSQLQGSSDIEGNTFTWFGHGFRHVGGTWLSYHTTQSSDWSGIQGEPSSETWPRMAMAPVSSGGFSGIFWSWLDVGCSRILKQSWFWKPHLYSSEVEHGGEGSTSFGLASVHGNLLLAWKDWSRVLRALCHVLWPLGTTGWGGEDLLVPDPLHVQASPSAPVSLAVTEV